MEVWLKAEDNAIRLPVLPREAFVSYGASVDSVSIVKDGEYDVYNGKSLATASLECFFPKHYTSFTEYRDIQDTYDYVEIIKNWAENGKLVRYIITDTNVNIEMRIINFTPGEKSGPRHVHYNLDLLEHRRNTFARSSVASKKDNAEKPSKRPSKSVETKKERIYTVKQGDCLWSIAKKYYGNGESYKKIYNANKDKIKNPNLIYPNQKLVIP